MLFHLKCCDENSIQEKAKTEFACDDCGKKIDDGESYWEIAVTKEQGVYNSIEPEWGESFKMFCEGCAQHTDLFVPALETITSVVKSEFRDKIVPMERTYVPSKVKRCSSCGSRKAWRPQPTIRRYKKRFRVKARQRKSQAFFNHARSLEIRWLLPIGSQKTKKVTTYKS